MSGIHQMTFMGLGIPAGEQSYPTAGTYTFIVPARVSSINVLCIGGGGAGAGADDTSDTAGSGGGGGACAYTNSISVTPGESLTVIVGSAVPSNKT